MIMVMAMVMMMMMMMAGRCLVPYGLCGSLGNGNEVSI